MPFFPAGHGANLKTVKIGTAPRLVVRIAWQGVYPMLQIVAPNSVPNSFVFPILKMMTHTEIMRVSAELLRTVNRFYQPGTRK